ncbi:hypothetical protein D9M71_727040 [compost metagenome]
MGVGIDRAAVGADWHSRHALYTTGNDGPRFACAQCGGCEVDRFKARGAVAIELQAWHALVVVGNQGRNPGNIATLLSGRHDTTQQNIIDQAGIELAAIAQGAKRLGCQRGSTDFMQCAIRAALAARAAYVVVDKGVIHVKDPSRSERRRTAA